MICRERQVAIMPRPKKFPDYNADKIQKELIKAVVESYEETGELKITANVSKWLFAIFKDHIQVRYCEHECCENTGISKT